MNERILQKLTGSHSRQALAIPIVNLHRLFKKNNTNLSKYNLQVYPLSVIL